MRNIFDSHAHYDDERFDEDRSSLLGSLPGKGISYIVNCGSDIKSSEFSISLSQEYDYIYAAVGVHPQECGNGVDMDKLSKLSAHSKVVAIGEIGLDYYYPEPDREVQKIWFEKQLAFAKSLDLPVIIHNRDAYGDMLEILKKYKPRGVMHCFSGSVEYSKEILRLGMYIGLGGSVTFKNAKHPKEVAAAVPLSMLLLETDAPYMTPVPFRGKRCDSSHIAYTAEVIAEIRGIKVQELLDASSENAKTLFSIK